MHKIITAIITSPIIIAVLSSEIFSDDILTAISEKNLGDVHATEKII